MNYIVEVEINVKLNRVIELFTDVKQMIQWEKNLLRVEKNRGHLFDTNSSGYLIYQVKDHEMKMSVTTELNRLPHEIVLIYEVPGAWNRCVNTFFEIDGKTLWKMNVEFKFEEDNKIPIDIFIEQTKHGMNLFKAFVEVRHEKN